MKVKIKRKGGTYDGKMKKEGGGGTTRCVRNDSWAGVPDVWVPRIFGELAEDGKR